MWLPRGAQARAWRRRSRTRPGARWRGKSSWRPRLPLSWGPRLALAGGQVKRSMSGARPRDRLCCSCRHRRAHTCWRLDLERMCGCRSHQGGRGVLWGRAGGRSRLAGCGGASRMRAPGGGLLTLVGHQPGCLAAARPGRPCHAAALLPATGRRRPQATGRCPYLASSVLISVPSQAWRGGLHRPSCPEHTRFLWLRSGCLLYAICLFRNWVSCEYGAD